MVLRFEQHVKSRWCEVVRAKFDFWLQLPYAFLGLFGSHMGHPLDECASLGRHIRDTWDACAKKSSMHRVAVEFFATAALVTQLEEFSAGGKHLHEFPELFDFVLRPLGDGTALTQRCSIPTIRLLIGFCPPFSELTGLLIVWYLLNVPWVSVGSS